MKILVTGASGFIGRHLIPRLLLKGHEVIATSHDKEKAAGLPWLRETKYVPFDLRQSDIDENLYRYFQEPDMLIHLAWEGLPHYTEAFHLTANLPRHQVFLSNLIQHGLQNLTVTGTCFEYGMREGMLSEHLPARPENAYALAKDTLRTYLEGLQADVGFSFKWVRLFYMYGAGQHPRSLFAQLEAAIAQGAPVFNMSGGEQVRDFLPVTQMAAIIAELALQAASGIFNACSGRPVQLKDLVRQYLEKRGADIRLNLGYYPYPAYEPMRFWGSTEKLRRVIAFPVEE